MDERAKQITHLREIRTDIVRHEINFSLSNMGFMLQPDELPFSRENIRLAAMPADLACGSRDLRTTLSRREGVPEENILLSLGASMANYLVMAALLQPGDEVLVEFPAYEPLLKVPMSLGAQVKRLPRDPVDFSLSPQALAEAVSDKTRMIVLTDSHNPSGNQLSQETLQSLKEISRDLELHVLIDEAYGRYYRENSLFTDYPGFIITGSLAKFHGLGSMRVGWAFAPSEVLEKARNFQDLITPELPITPLHLAHLLLSSPAYDSLEERVRERVRRNRELVISYIDRTELLTTYIPRNGVLFFPEIKAGIDVDEFHRILASEYSMSVTRGSLFEMPRNFRLAAVWDELTMKEGLRRIEAALNRAAD